jgi:colanic acid biosynthesis glycosyl transferase WcaI
MTREKILFITQHYWPELIGSGPYCTDIANWLRAHDYPVDVFTCRPHYPEGVVPPAYQYGQRDNEEHRNVAIRRVGTWMPRKRGAAARMLAEFTFLARGLWSLLTGRLKRSELVISLCPSILAVLLGVFATRRHGRHIAIVHDIQSGLAAGLGMVQAAGPLVRAIRELERIVLNKVDVVLVPSDSMRRHLRDLHIKCQIEVLPLWVDLNEIKPYPRSGGSTITALYSGNFGRKQSLDQILDMAALLAARDPNIAVFLRGDGSETKTLTETVAERGLRNVRFAPLVSAEHLARGLSEGDIHLVPQNGNVADFAVPSKIFSIMAAGRPFVAAAKSGSLLWKLKDESQAFLCVPAGDVTALADAVERLAQDAELREELGSNGRQYAVLHHDKEIILERLRAILLYDRPQRIGHAKRAPASSDL